MSGNLINNFFYWRMYSLACGLKSQEKEILLLNTRSNDWLNKKWIQKKTELINSNRYPLVTQMILNSIQLIQNIIEKITSK